MNTQNTHHSAFPPPFSRRGYGRYHLFGDRPRSASATWRAAVAADPKIDALVAKAIEYLAKSQSARRRVLAPGGHWRDGPGDHRAAAKRPLAGRPAGGPQPEVPGKLRPARRRHLQPEAGLQELRDVHRPDLLRRGQRRQALREDHPQRGEVSQGDPVDRGRERKRHDEEDRQVRSVLRRRRLRPQQAAGPVQHGLHGRCLEGGRQRARRRGDEEGPGLRLPLPEPGERVQHDARPRPRTPTAASTTRPPTAATARPASCPTAACGATPR